MGVFIKGMEMPDSCIACVFGKEINYAGDFKEKCLVNDKYGYVSVRKPRLETCPLVEVKKPHGDLVDKDKLMTEVMDSDLDHLQRDDWKEVIQIVADADVVIEAEGENDGQEKYVFEASDDVKKVIAMGVTRGGAIWTDTMDVENFEELNSDYINEHFSDLQDTAYQRGLDDAWEAARKIVRDEELDWNTLLHIFNRSNFEGIFGDFSPSEAIEKLKAYEEKQKADDEIKVGDEVISLRKNGEVIEDMPPWIVTYETKYSYQGFDACGAFHNNPKNCVRKTGRHFDIDKILEEMRT